MIVQLTVLKDQGGGGGIASLLISRTITLTSTARKKADNEAENRIQAIGMMPT